MADRWGTYGGAAPQVAPGWSFEPIVGPARLWGANGIVYDPAGQLLVTQVFGSQVTAIDVASGEHQVFSALGAGIAAPDDGVFAFDGTFFATEPMNATVSARNPDGTYRTLRDDLPGINGITMDPSRRRLFADEFRPGGRLWELDPAGERPPTLLADELNGPNALAVGPDGAVWFPSVIGGEIWRYDLDDRSLRRMFTDLAAPVAVKFDSAGRLVTPESALGRVTRIDLASGARETIAQVPRGIDNIALSPDDRLFISHFVDGRVSEATAGGGERILSESGLVGPFGVAVAADGRILVADGLSVAVVDRDGSISRTHTLIADLPTLAVDIATLDGDPVVLGQRGQVFLCREGEGTVPIAGRLAAPTGLADSGDGAVLVVEQPAGRVVRVDATGVTGELAVGLARPYAATVTADGTMWVSCADALVSLRDGAVLSRLESLAGCQGLAAGTGAAAGTVVAVHPPSGRVVAVDAAGGTIRTLVDAAPVTSPVARVDLPHSSASVAADGDGFLVGCGGDGTIRRLVAS